MMKISNIYFTLLILVMLPLHAAQKPPAELEQLKTKLTQVKGSLGNLKAGLGTLKNKIGDLKGKLEGLAGIATKPAAAESYKKTGLSAETISIFKDFIKLIDSYNSTRLDEIAIGDKNKLTGGYGYKTANLMLLTELVQKIGWQSITGLKIEIPEFVGISTWEIKNYLQSKMINVDDLWQELIKKFFPDGSFITQTASDGAEEFIPQGSFADAFDKKEFPHGFLEELKKIEETVKNAFTDFTELKTFLVQTSPPDAKTSQQKLNELIAKLTSNNEKFMVRSTGKEDTDKLANAGGNESIANVNPEDNDLINALGEVIASYFSAKSVKQRLGARDISLFKDEPFIPAVFQRMVGETRGGQEDDTKEKRAAIPRCGVMFTEETEGSLSKLGNKTKTSGITVIQASYGHNEGVVNSIVPVDTYYIDLYGYIYSILVSKKIRIIPLIPDPTQTNPKKLGPTVNSAELADTSALNSRDVATLKMLALLLEHYYQKPMDVEYARLLDTLYIVQARPIVHNPHQPKACYLTDLSTFDEKITGSSIGVAGGKLRILKNLNQCVIKPNMSDALTTYQDPAVTKPTMIECIIVGEPAPITSHEATTFRGELKPVLYVKDFATIEQWLTAGKKIVVDMQQNTVVVWDESKKGSINELENFISSLDTTTPQTSYQHAKSGWFNYPIPDKLSIGILEKIAQAHFSFLNIKNIITKDPTIKKYRINAGLYESLKTEKIKIRELIKRLKDASSLEDANTYLKIITKHLLTELAKTKDTHIIELNDIQKKLEKLLSVFLMSWEHISRLIPNSATEPIQKLYAIKFLEIILLQHPEDILNAYSFATYLDQIAILNTGRTALAIQKDDPEALKKEKEKAAVYYTFGRFGLENSVTDKWHEFVREIPHFSDEEPTTAPTLLSGNKGSYKDHFGNLIHRVSTVGMLPLWLNFSFIKAATQFPANNFSILKTLVDEYLKAEPFLKELNEKLDLMKQSNLDVLADPNKFEKAWNPFKDNLINYFVSDQFIARFQAQGSFGKLYALNIMDQFVNKFDLGIKAVTGSPEYVIDIFDSSKPRNNKAYTVKEMLQEYISTLAKWRPLENTLLEYNEHDITDPKNTIIKTALKTKVDDVTGILTSLNPGTNDTQNLSASKNFNVAAGALGSGADSSVNKPTTFEDIFTFTHQSLLNVLSAILLEQKIQETMEIPDFIKLIQAKTTSLAYRAGYTDIKDSKLIGIQIFGQTIIYIYNWALREHSAQIRLEYDGKKNKKLKEKKECVLHLSLLGDNEYGRFDRAADFGQLAGSLANFTNLPFLMKGKGCTLKWMLHENTSKLDSLSSIIQGCATVTFDTDDVHTIKDGENSFFNRLGYHDTEDKKQTVATRIIDLSVVSNHVHWLLPQALKILYSASVIHVDIFTNLLAILEKLYPYNNKYSLESQLFLFKRVHDPRYDQPYEWEKEFICISNDYYKLFSDNYVFKINPNNQKQYRDVYSIGSADTNYSNYKFSANRGGIIHFLHEKYTSMTDTQKQKFQSLLKTLFIDGRGGKVSNIAETKLKELGMELTLETKNELYKRAFQEQPREFAAHANVKNNLASIKDWLIKTEQKEIIKKFFNFFQDQEEPYEIQKGILTTIEWFKDTSALLNNPAALLNDPEIKGSIRDLLYKLQQSGSYKQGMNIDAQNAYTTLEEKAKNLLQSMVSFADLLTGDDNTLLSFVTKNLALKDFNLIKPKISTLISNFYSSSDKNVQEHLLFLINNILNHHATNESPVSEKWMKILNYNVKEKINIDIVKNILKEWPTESSDIINSNKDFANHLAEYIKIKQYSTSDADRPEVLLRLNILEILYEKKLLLDSDVILTSILNFVNQIFIENTVNSIFPQKILDWPILAESWRLLLEKNKINENYFYGIGSIYSQCMLYPFIKQKLACIHILLLNKCKITEFLTDATKDIIGFFLYGDDDTWIAEQCLETLKSNIQNNNYNDYEKFVIQTGLNAMPTSAQKSQLEKILKGTP